MLLDLLRQRYLEMLRSVPSRWKILIVDEYTRPMLNSVLSTYDILEEGVQQVDVITAPRSPQPRLAAIYLVMPTDQNVDLIVRDFAPHSSPNSNSARRSSKKREPAHGSGQVEPPRYASAYLQFLEGIDDRLVGRLTSELPHTYLLALKELYLNLHALESRVFSLKSPHAFLSLYSPPGLKVEDSVARWNYEISRMSHTLVNALATLGEYPMIRYYSPPSSFHSLLGPAAAAGESMCKRLAERVQAEIDAYARDNSDFPVSDRLPASCTLPPPDGFALLVSQPVSDPPRPRGVLLITDRSMDLYAPFVHEFTYQAMCNDLLNIEDGRTYKYTFRNASNDIEDKEAILTEEDSVWTEVRHMHMKDALDKLIADFKAYAGEHDGKFGQSGGTSLNDMKDMLASLPQLRETKEKLSLHLTMAEKCMHLFEKKKLPSAAFIEQCCATGVTPEGKTPKTLVEEMVPLLDDRSVSSTDKLRIIALYIMHRDGVPEGDRKRLYQHARLALHEMDAVDNLSQMGINVSKDSGKKRKALFKQRPEEDSYDISRFQPALKYMLEEHFSGSLDQSTFPYVRDAPPSGGSSSSRATSAAPAQAGSLRSARPQWTATRGRRTVAEPRQRVVVFVAGGMTFSEVRAVYKLSESANKDIVIGSTNTITPEQFVSDLSNLDRGPPGGDTSPIPPTALSAPRKESKASNPTSLSQQPYDRSHPHPHSHPSRQPQYVPEPHSHPQSHPHSRGRGPPPSNCMPPPSNSYPIPTSSRDPRSLSPLEYAPPSQTSGLSPRMYSPAPSPSIPSPSPTRSFSTKSSTTYTSVSTTATSTGMEVKGSSLNGTAEVVEKEKKKKKKLFGF
ncbi:BQ2448_212 [Microbotryum intermedium]|uniref:BQ2448_212 protein n=1 Tax=Microbotryum intermedium TaxID=269621 RepID=A0A238F7N4_9BASI|nr:BQ2448_212 [Microbotryum intermedium]